MQSEAIKINGRTFVTNSAWTFGDYGGCGSYGLANIRIICEDSGDKVLSLSSSSVRDAIEGPKTYGKKIVSQIMDSHCHVIHVTGDYSGEWVYVRQAVDHANGYSERCDSYPALDDERASEIESEWLDDAWNDWLKSDLIKDAFPEGDAPDKTDSEYREAFHDAMDGCNEYPEAEYSSVFVRVERISAAFRRIITAE